MPFRLRALAVGVVVAFGGCTRGAAPAPATGQLPPDAEARFAVYDLGSAWLDQDGRARGIASLAGRPVVMAMIYTHCSSTCPLIIGEMKRIEHATASDVSLVLVTLDPDRDTPGRLAGYAATEGLDRSRWTLLAGSDLDTRALAATLGVRYRRLSPDELAHSNTITLLDAGGAIVRQETGIGAATAMLDAIGTLPRGSTTN